MTKSPEDALWTFLMRVPPLALNISLLIALEAEQSQADGYNEQRGSERKTHRL